MKSLINFIIQKYHEFRIAFGFELFLVRLQKWTAQLIYDMPRDEALRQVTRTRFKLASYPESEFTTQYYAALNHLEEKIKELNHIGEKDE